MRKSFSKIFLATLVLGLSACGGGDKAFVTPGTSGGANVASLAVSSDVASIPSDGSTPATITVVAKDSSNTAVSGAAVSFAASAGNITVTQATTDSTGTATATLVAGSAAPGTTITVTATSGTVSGHTTVTVSNAQKTLTLLTSLPQIPSDGSQTATITALVRDANNNFVSGTDVAFQASSGGITVTQGTTDTSGSATATLSSAGDTTNRTITVTATAGTASATITVGVVGTKLTLSGPTNLIQGASGTYTVSLTDAGGNGIAGQTVTLTSSAGNTLTPTTYMSDATGQKTFTLQAVNSGNDTLTVAAAGLQATQTVAVSNDSFSFTTPAANTKVNLSTAQTLIVHWTSAGVAQVGKTVSFSATRGTLSAATAVTDASGNATVTISSTLSGPSVISATSTGVTAQTSIDFIATTPATLKAQASPASIAPQGTSTITVTVRDAANNLVEGQIIDFLITQDSTGGSLTASSATTDSQGQASTQYKASTTTSPKDGVVVQATVRGTPTVHGSTSLTVAGQTVFLSLGTGNTILSYPNQDPTDTQYELPYSVQAVDNAGHGVGNATVTYTITSLVYLKGKHVFNTTWAPVPSTSQVVPTNNGYEPDWYLLTGIYGCKSEDVNNDGIYALANDYNSNGKLDPGLIVNTDVAGGTTGADGSAHFNLIYPKDHAYWVGVRLTVTATVAGTQSSTSADFWLPGAAPDYATQTVAPPGLFSPYGQGTTCQNPN